MCDRIREITEVDSTKVPRPGDGARRPSRPLRLPGEWSTATVLRVPPGPSDANVYANPDQQKGDEWIFAGSKTFSCDSGHTFTADYKASRSGEARQDRFGGSSSPALLSVVAWGRARTTRQKPVA